MKRVFINAMTLKVKEIEDLRAKIIAGVITPDKNDVAQMVKEEYIEDYMNGKRILPQAYYIINE